MKKLLSLALCFALMASCCSMAGCGGKDKQKEFEPELDIANEYKDDFNNIDFNYWSIMQTRWGGNAHGGVLRDNVGYTSDGNLVITANGDYYNGEKKDVDGNVAKRTGGAIVSHQTLGPGVFSIRMKAMPRFGATTAFWTFWNDGHTKNDSGLVYNSEIDFELNVQSFDTTMCTNWTSEETFDSHKAPTSFYHNDGNWHEYTFKWMTAPERVDYYVDGVKLHTSLSNVPTYAANANIGVWFAGFAGTPDFETDYCYVDWFKYTPYLDQPYTKTRDTTPPINDNGYPITPTQVPEKINLVGDGGFENPYYSENRVQNAWFMYPGDKDKARTLSDAKIPASGIDGSVALVLKSFYNDISKKYSSDKVIQTFTQVYPGYKMDFSAYFKHSAAQSGKCIIQYYKGTEDWLGEEEIAINSSTAGFVENEFYKVSKLITVPAEINGEKVGRARIRFSADDKENNQIIIDNVFANHIKN